MLPTMAGAAKRCVIPEHKFNIERLTELLSGDRRRKPSRYSVVLISEGAMFEGGEMTFECDTTDAFGHKKLGGIGDLVSEKIKELSPKYNKEVSVYALKSKSSWNQQVKGKTKTPLTRSLVTSFDCGDPDAIDSVVPMAYGNLAFDWLLSKIHGGLVVWRMDATTTCLLRS